MEAHLLSTKAKIKNMDAVEEILSTYLTNLNFVISKQKQGCGHTLQVVGDGWPLALHEDHWPPESDDLYDAYNAPADEDYSQGETDFYMLLLELAPELETPLRILVGDHEGLCWGVTEWIADPANGVEITTIDPILDEEVRASLRKQCGLPPL